MIQYRVVEKFHVSNLVQLGLVFEGKKNGVKEEGKSGKIRLQRTLQDMTKYLDFILKTGGSH